MATQPPDPEVEKLLAELRSDWAYRRQDAAEKIAELKLGDDELISLLKVIASKDENKFVRRAAGRALATFGVVVPPPQASAPNPGSPVKAVEPLIHRSEVVQLSIGFVGWYLANLALTYIWGGPSLANANLQAGQTGPGVSIGLLLFPANILTFFVLVRVRGWVAFGMLTAVAINLFVTLVVGAALAGFCFVPFFTPGLR